MKDAPKLLLTYRTSPDADSLEIANAVLLAYYASGNFVTPPISAATLKALIDALVSAIAAMAQGGTQATLERDVEREKLIDGLDDLVNYAQLEAKKDLVKLASSGFGLAKRNTSRLPLAKPTGLRAANGQSSETLVSCDKIVNSRVFELQKALVGADGSLGDFEAAGLHTNCKRIPVTDLTPGTVYAYRGRGVGGSTGYSDWSDTILHRAA